MKKIGYDMLYLTICGLNGVVPNKDKLQQIDLQNLFQMCKFHSLTAIVDIALESAGIKDEQFIQGESRAIKKNLMLDTEREKICEFMEQNHIWYMPLKGVILKNLYPKIGMRQMADNDILYDSNYQKQVKEYMKKNGYTAQSVGKNNHDVYMKAPIYNYEMHTSLFDLKHDDNLYNYYKNIKRQLVKDNSKEYAYHFTDEDFYVYITAHEYKHYSDGGTGLRSLMDCYVYLKAKSNTMNWDYISNQLKKLGIADFEKKSRVLAQKVFSNPVHTKLSDEETEMLEFYLFSGTYGTMTNRVKNNMNKNGSSKLKYLLSRTFPPMEFIRKNYPFFYKYKFLMPFCWIFRIVRGFTVRNKKISAEIKAVKNFET
jgi:hypothetical protein